MKDLIYIQKSVDQGTLTNNSFDLRNTTSHALVFDADQKHLPSIYNNSNHFARIVVVSLDQKRIHTVFCHTVVSTIQKRLHAGCFHG